MKVAGCQPALLAPEIVTEPEQIMASLDGLLLTGGGDIAPHYYGQTLAGTDPDSVNEERDKMELSLFAAAHSADKPIFGICRGFQVINVAMMGGLLQDFPGHTSDHTHPGHMHVVDILPGSQLANSLSFSGKLAVNTYHHQGVTEQELAPDLLASGRAVPNNWLIEGFESLNATWIIGVQWHPERYIRDDLPRPHMRLFESFCVAMQRKSYGT